MANKINSNWRTVWVSIQVHPLSKNYCLNLPTLFYIIVFFVNISLYKITISRYLNISCSLPSILDSSGNYSLTLILLKQHKTALDSWDYTNSLEAFLLM